MVSGDVAASDKFQAWLRFKNAHGWDIFLALNTFQPDAQHRTKDDLLQVRHCWLDIDSDGVAAQRLQPNRFLGLEVPVDVVVIEAKHLNSWHLRLASNLGVLPQV